MIHYVDRGKRDGIPVVLLHGFPFTHEMWEPQIAELEKDYRVIAPDVRGHGRTELGTGQYLLEFFVDDLVSLLNELGIERAVICGLSMGGYIAQRFAEREPERLRALVLCDTRSEADSDEIKLRRAGAIRVIETEGLGAYAENFLKGVFAPEAFEKKPELVDHVRSMILSNRASGLIGALIALAARTDTTASLEKVSVPALLVFGEQDSLTPPSVGIAMLKRIARGELNIVPDAGHLSNLENPEAFNACLRDFLLKLKR